MALESIFRTLNTLINLDINVIVENVLKDEGFQKFIISLNQNEQLFEEGIDALGSSLGQYADVTIQGVEGKFKGKEEKGQRFDHITLLDTGKFYKSFAIKVQNGGFLIVADGNKDDSNLFDDFGKDILGLTDENLQIVIDAIKERLIPEIIKSIQD